jgi:coenzyme F420-0:L-glutamate ligase/coenzyme F420-1:gamma-L-glutamate ligase
MNLEIVPLRGLPLVGAGADIPGLILEAMERSDLVLENDDIVVVTGKVVSKAEGLLVDLDSLQPTPRAERLATETGKDPRLVELVLQESVDVIRARFGNLLVRHRRGYVSGMAGIDRSNVDGDDEHALILPKDPDASAEAIREALHDRSGVRVGVVISDSHGRPFRIGNVGVALGTAGFAAVHFLEGRPDLFGRPLTGASVVPVADLLASTAMLVSGEADEGLPVILVRGLHLADGPETGASLIRPPEQDLFAIPDRDYH